MSHEVRPDAAAPTPQVLWWFRIYCGFLCVLYLLTAAMSLIFFLVSPADLDMPPMVAHLTGGLLLVLGLGLFVVCLLPLIFAPRPWLWVYDLVIICLGMTSACTMVVSVPLLIYWLKPETKRYFGKT